MKYEKKQIIQIKIFRPDKQTDIQKKQDLKRIYKAEKKNKHKNKDKGKFNWTTVAISPHFPSFRRAS